MGDARHQKTKSDHNLGNAFDLTHDPAAGCDGNLIAAAALRDPRTKYVIWNKQIWNKQRGDRRFRRYTGKNPHTKHCHVSILSGSRADTRPWEWAPGGGVLAPLPGSTAVESPAGEKPKGSRGGGDAPSPADRRTFPGVVLRRGRRGDLVKLVQQRLRRLKWDVDDDGVFGDDTERVVKAFQKRRGLEIDGEVGRRTWNALFG